jgi:hypothetical protein
MMLRVRDGSESFVFFNLNLFCSKTQRLQRTARPKVARRNDESQLQGHAQMPIRTAEIHKNPQL